jgi:hypothetical protein
MARSIWFAKGTVRMAKPATPARCNAIESSELPEEQLPQSETPQRTSPFSRESSPSNSPGIR